MDVLFSFTVFIFVGLPILAAVAGAIWVLYQLVHGSELPALKLVDGEIVRRQSADSGWATTRSTTTKTTTTRSAIAGSTTTHSTTTRTSVTGRPSEPHPEAPAAVPDGLPPEAIKACEEAIRCLSSAEPAENADQLRAVALPEAVEEMVSAAEASVSEATAATNGTVKPAIRLFDLMRAPIALKGGEVAVDFRIVYAVKVGKSDRGDMYAVYRDQVWRARAVMEKLCRTCGAPIRKNGGECEYCGATPEYGDWKLTTAIPMARSSSPAAVAPPNQAGMLLVADKKWGKWIYLNKPFPKSGRQ